MRESDFNFILDHVDWESVSQDPNISEDFINRYGSRLDWFWLSSNETLSEDCIRENAKFVDWEGLCERDVQLSEDFIRDFQDEVVWWLISENQKLSEDFIREFSHLVDWRSIEIYQDLSQSFIEEHIDKIELDAILENESRKNLSDEFILKNARYVTDINLFKDILSDTNFNLLKNLVEVNE